MYWLSYGGGVNSTALAILLCRGLPQYKPWRIIFADTGEERPETYSYIRNHFNPWLTSQGLELEIVRAAETVLERWERIRSTGSRIQRICTVESKIKPMERHIAANGGGQFLIGIDAGESHRMPDAIRPLVYLDIDRDECERIIRGEGLPSPGKSGCWCCPFLRVSEVIHLLKTNSCRFERIERLENIATLTHGLDINGRPRSQWGNKPAAYYRDRAKQGDLFYDDGSNDGKPHCGCYDG